MISVDFILAAIFRSPECSFWMPNEPYMAVALTLASFLLAAFLASFMPALPFLVKKDFGPFVHRMLFYQIERLSHLSKRMERLDSSKFRGLERFCISLIKVELSKCNFLLHFR